MATGNICCMGQAKIEKNVRTGLGGFVLKFLKITLTSTTQSS